MEVEPIPRDLLSARIRGVNVECLPLAVVLRQEVETIFSLACWYDEFVDLRTDVVVAAVDLITIGQRSVERISVPVIVGNVVGQCAWCLHWLASGINKGELGFYTLHSLRELCHDAVLYTQIERRWASSGRFAGNSIRNLPHVSWRAFNCSSMKLEVSFTRQLLVVNALTGLSRRESNGLIGEGYRAGSLRIELSSEVDVVEF